MNDEERDAFYDEHIAPKLARIANESADNGISFVAAADTGICLNETVRYADGWSAAFKLAALAVDAHGNVDKLMLGVVKYINRYGVGVEHCASMAVRRFMGVG